MTLLTDEQIQIATACASRNNPECSKCIFTDAPVCTDSLMAALIEDRNEMIKIIEDKDAESIKRLRDFAKMLGLSAQPKDGEEDDWVYLTDGIWINLNMNKEVISAPQLTKAIPYIDVLEAENERLRAVRDVVGDFIRRGENRRTWRNLVKALSALEAEVGGDGDGGYTVGDRNDIDQICRDNSAAVEVRIKNDCSI